jgi:uncharacterized phage protein (TIGR01671 family)
MKFRVWCKDFNEWEKDPVFLNEDGTIYQMNKSGRLMLFKPDNHIVVRFTGLKDKNGKEIFESDICRFIVGYFDQEDECDVFPTHIPERIFVRKIEIDPYMGVYGVISSFCDIGEPLQIEVIGNIFENGDLLK